MTETANLGVAPAVVAKPRSRRFAVNLISNVGKLGLMMIVGAWYVPFLVRELGPAAYGLVPLASSVTAYMGLITLGLNSAVGRSLTIALEREEHAKANLIFNVSLWGSLILCAGLLIPAAIAIANIEHIIRVPPGWEGAARWLFAGTIGAFLLNQIKTPFGTCCFSRNRLDLDNLVAIGELLTRVGVVVGLFALFSPKIQYVGAAILAGTVVSAVGMFWLWRVLTPSLSIELNNLDWTMLKSLCSTGGWVIVSQLGVLLYMNIDLLLANRLFGAEQGGRYAAVLQLPALLRQMSIAVGGIFAPTMFHIYAREDAEALVVYLNQAIKFVGLVIALPIGLVCGFSGPLLRLWLGDGFGSMAPLLCLMTIHLCVNLAVYPLYNVPLAANRVKVPGLVTLAIGIGNLLLALLFAGVLGWGLYGLAAAGGIMLTIRHLLFTPLYGAHVLKQGYGIFYKNVLGIAIATVCVTGLGQIVLGRWPIRTWTELVAAGCGVSVAYIVLVFCLLSERERAALKRFMRQSRAAT